MQNKQHLKEIDPVYIIYLKAPYYCKARSKVHTLHIKQLGTVVIYGETSCASAPIRRVVLYNLLKPSSNN